MASIITCSLPIFVLTLLLDHQYHISLHCGTNGFYLLVKQRREIKMVYPFRSRAVILQNDIVSNKMMTLWTSHIPTITIMIHLEICELLSHHLFLKRWCDPWGVWFTLKSWFNEPWGQMEPHTNSSAVKWTHVYVKHLVRRERATASDSFFHPTVQGVFVPRSCAHLLNNHQGRGTWKVENDWWNASGSRFLSADTDEPTEPRLWLVAGRTPS